MFIMYRSYGKKATIRFLLKLDNSPGAEKLNLNEQDKTLLISDFAITIFQYHSFLYFLIYLRTNFKFSGFDAVF